MGFMDEMMGKAPSLMPITGKERETLSKEMQPIANLKPGDKLRWKNAALKDGIAPKLEEAIEVFRVLEPEEKNRIIRTEKAGNHGADCPDFTAIFTDTNDGDYVEFLYDSRRFVRVK